MSAPLEFEAAHEVPRGSLVVFRNPTVGIPTDISRRMEEASQMIASKVGHSEFAAIMLGPDASVQVLDETTMAGLGWFRLPRK